MTDVGLLAATVLWLAWLEWRDWRRQWAWEKSQAMVNEQKKAETDLLLARQSAVMSAAMNEHHKHLEETFPEK